ncbi:arylesterase [Polynucleobacter wuianus]|uniref:Arylesterase n=2 Tax=Burkholderiaceae TaxID=119060 RepID=A0A191UF44_9BURK|nr:arylesterase [Polynucleobacter wuianus]MBU3551809.1 arylesterase [Polynucleobacter sp. MWH-Post4-6-1]MBU3610778.1 arylesterase [Polynucleobacter wuianus]
MNQGWLTCWIKKLISIGLFCLLMPIVTASHANPVILVMGDSLSAEYGLPRGSGWVKLLEVQLEKQASPWKVFNASISGETSSGGLTRLPALLESKKPRIVLLELGANDALRGLSIEQTQNNLQKMIALSKQSGAKVLLMGMQIPPNYGQQYTKQFKDLYPKLASQEGIELLPFFMAGVASNKDLFQSDNIHPNVTAQSILFKNVWGAMAPYQSLLQQPQ